MHVLLECRCRGMPCSCSDWAITLIYALLLQEIYGMDQAGGGGGAKAELTEAEAEDRLCVICLVNERDTTVLPCRHMCMCHGARTSLPFCCRTLMAAILLSHTDGCVCQLVPAVVVSAFGRCNRLGPRRC